jgi:hypothetical protein
MSANKNSAAVREKKGRPAQLMPFRPAALAGLFFGIGVLVAGMVCLYTVMRAVGLDNGGSCVSGGPYEIAPGRECADGVFGLAFGGVFAILAGFALFLWSAHIYGRQLAVTAATGFAWTAFWCGLGGSFVSIAFELPAASETASEFDTVGTVFLVLGVFGLLLVAGTVVYSLRKEMVEYPKLSAGGWTAFIAAILFGASSIGIAAMYVVPRIWNG